MQLHQLREQPGAGSRPAVSGGPACPPGLQDASVRDALRDAVGRLDVAEARGHPQEICLALLPVAGCYRALGAWSAAEDILRQALRLARAHGPRKQLVDVLIALGETACELADCADHRGSPSARAARDRARDEAFEAATLAHRSSDPHWGAEALIRISQLLQRCGDTDDAAGLQARALALVAQA